MFNSICALEREEWNWYGLSIQTCTATPPLMPRPMQVVHAEGYVI